MPSTKRTKTRQVPIMRTNDDKEGILYPHKDTLVIKANVASRAFKRIPVDIGSSIDILFKSTLEQMGIIYLRLKCTNTSLKGFGGRRSTP